MTSEPPSDAILARLLSLHPKLVDLSLGRMHRLLAALGNPERHVPPAVHVTGTNGKGSTLAFLRAMLEAAGYRVHVYASPHLVRFHERIRLAGTLISEDHLQAVLDECEAANEGQEITFFEITTAAAFLAFSRSDADILLLENGLGGRLDATNVIDRPLLTGITTVSLDHQQFLGGTLEKIAFEKAGIIKPGVPCVVGPQPPEALGVIRAGAASKDARVIAAGEHWNAVPRGEGFRVTVGHEALDLPAPVLPGAHQIGNAGMAAVMARTLEGFDVSDADVAAGLKTAEWPARLQRLREGPVIDALPSEWEVWLDGGHNPDAGATIAGHAQANWSDAPLYLIAGMIASKAATDYFRPLAKIAERVQCIEIPDEAAAIPATDLAEAARAAGHTADPFDSLDAAVSALPLSGPGTARVLICGSLYLAGQILRGHR